MTTRSALTSPLSPSPARLLGICMGAMFTDQLRYARFDWSIITGERKRRWPQAFYFFAKLAFWPYVASCIALIESLDKVACQALIDTCETFMGLITVSCSVLLACRTLCVYSGTQRTVVGGFLTVFGLGQLAAWMVGVTDITAVWVPGMGAAWTTGTCNFTNVSVNYMIKFIITMAFDFTVMILTAFGVMRMHGGGRIGKILVQQGIIYFFLTFAINAMLAGFTAAQLNPVMSLSLAVPANCITVMAAVRLYVDLAESARPSNGNNTPLSSYGSGGNKLSSNPFRKSKKAGTPYGVPGLEYNEPSSPSADKFGTSSSAASGTRSNDDLEKAMGTHSHNAVTVRHTEEVTSEPLPAHLSGPPFVNESDSSSDHVARQFPRLAGRQ